MISTTGAFVASYAGNYPYDIVVHFCYNCIMVVRLPWSIWRNCVYSVFLH